MGLVYSTGNISTAAYSTGSSQWNCLFSWFSFLLSHIHVVFTSEDRFYLLCKHLVVNVADGFSFEYLFYAWVNILWKEWGLKIIGWFTESVRECSPMTSTNKWQTLAPPLCQPLYDFCSVLFSSYALSNLKLWIIHSYRVTSLKLFCTKLPAFYQSFFQ